MNVLNKFVFLSVNISALLTAAKGVFPCELCGRTYNRKDNLLRHQRLECGKEPQFSCPACPYKAKQKSTLRTHVGLKHTELIQANIFLLNQ